MEYKDIVKDFTNRTKANLYLIRKEAEEGKDAFEVTQLINSMLGLLVFPQQRFYDKIPETPIKDLEKEGWPIPKVVGSYPQVENLKELARYLRNGISHFNVEFTFVGGHVDGLIIWNKTPSGKVNWKATLKLNELDGIVNKFTDLLMK